MSKDAKSFVRAFKNMLTRELKDSGIQVVDIHSGHYDLSGFLQRGNTYVYVSYSIPRYGKRIDFNAIGACDGVLYRSAEGLKDFRGGNNNFCSIYELPIAIKRFFDQIERSEREVAAS